MPKKSIGGKGEFVEIDEEIELCFRHMHDRKYDKYRSTKFDWHVIDVEVYRLILRGKYMLTNGLIYETIYLALRLLRRVGEGYGEDLVYQDNDLDGLDFSTKDAVSLLKEAMKHQCVTKKDIMNIAEELDKISVLEAYSSYCLYDFSDLLDNIKKRQL